MSTKFYTNVLIVLIAGLVVALSVGMHSIRAIGWSAFGLAIGAVVICGLAQLDTHRGLTQRALDAAIAATAGTMIGVSVAYAGLTVKWTDFALALGLAALAFAGMSLHEVENWRRTRELSELHWLTPEFAPPPRREAQLTR